MALVASKQSSSTASSSKQPAKASAKKPAQAAAKKQDVSLEQVRTAFESVVQEVAKIGGQLAAHLQPITAGDATVHVSVGDNVVVLQIDGHDPVSLSLDAAGRLRRDLDAASLAAV